jgi:hypothetical protein
LHIHKDDNAPFVFTHLESHSDFACAGKPELQKAAFPGLRSRMALSNATLMGKASADCVWRGSVNRMCVCEASELCRSTGRLGWDIDLHTTKIEL